MYLIISDYVNEKTMKKAAANIPLVQTCSLCSCSLEQKKNCLSGKTQVTNLRQQETHNASQTTPV